MSDTVTVYEQPANLVTVYSQNNIAVFAQGLQGAAGIGVPVGGTTGQVLSKIDATDYHTHWVDPTAGGGAVSSVNSQTGAVVLTQDNIAEGSTNGVYTLVEKSKLAGIATGATANQTDAYLLARANHTGTQAANTITGLATVATSGAYADLSGKPTIPSTQVNSDWNATTGIAQILNRPSLATVATTGAYSDLSGKPTLGTLASQNGTFSGTSSGTNTGDQTITLTGDATGSGTGSFAVSVSKINGTSLAALGTGILKNTTATGVPSIAVAADFPTLNQNTTGSAAKLTTARNINGVAFDGTANITVPAAFTPSVNYYISSTTLSDPGAGCSLIRITGIGGGGGGGSGRNNATSVVRGGGAGGSAGTPMDITIPYSAVSSWPVTITIGAGGAGGAAIAIGTGANGNNGNNGGDTSFGSIVMKGGLGGTGGSTVVVAGGVARYGSLASQAPVGGVNPTFYAGGQGGIGANAGIFAGAPGFSGSGGGAGGTTSANVSAGGAAGGANQRGDSGGSGGAAGAAGSNGADGDTAAPYAQFGGSGGGGAGCSTTAAFAGGNGGKYGAGGGGGSNGTVSVNASGAGGNGADGFLKVVLS